MIINKKIKRSELPSDIYKRMNGRIIPASHIEKQVKKLQNAKNIADKKAAAAWHNSVFLGCDLPHNLGVPPYHFRCRTELVPVWINKQEITDDENKSVIMRSSEALKQGEIIRHIDKTGMERVLKVNNTHILQKHKEIKESTIIKALNSIKEVAPSIKDNRINAWTHNGYFIVLQNNDIVTIFKPYDKKVKVINIF